jgi:hypothetical protein
LTNLFKRGDLRINHHSEKKKKNRFRLRFHTAVVIKLIEKAIYDLGAIDEVSFQVCNDFDGHFKFWSEKSTSFKSWMKACSRTILRR